MLSDNRNGGAVVDDEEQGMFEDDAAGKSNGEVEDDGYAKAETNKRMNISCKMKLFLTIVR